MRTFQWVITLLVDGIDYYDRICFNFSFSYLSKRVNGKGIDGPAGN